ncbi:MAG: methyltransferase [Gammaproteobacteria bacterium]|nr:methyltransferase [Gammaproteobacteria bacterium]
MSSSFKDIENFREDLTFSETINQQAFKFNTTWGLFSPRNLDEGSRLLLENLSMNADDHCLDVGCGYGPLGLYMAKNTSNSVVMVDKDFVAIDYSKKNAKLNKLDNCDIFLSNGFNQIPPQTFSLIVSNLPAKVGNEMLSLYMIDAYNYLAPGGRFYVVTITGMRKFIQRSFNDIFGNYKKVKQGKTYTVAMTVKS